MDLFSWDLYRSMLVSTQPLVSQPSIVPHVPGGPSPRARRSLLPPAIQRRAAVAEAPQPLQVALPAVLAHRVGGRVAFSTARVPAVEADGRLRLVDTAAVDAQGRGRA